MQSIRTIHMTLPEEHFSLEPPDIYGSLSEAVDNCQADYEDRFAPPDGPHEVLLHGAIDAVESHALRLITTGDISAASDAELSPFMPGAALTEKLANLLEYNVVHHRIAFAVAHEVVSLLHGLSGRVRMLVLGYRFLHRAKPSVTAVKYFERAARLFLHGYGAEVHIMCGAVLEAAMRARFPDELLLAAGVKPKWRTGDYSIGQRMVLEEQEQVLTEPMRAEFWAIVNDRNIAVHTQPDLGPAPAVSLLMTAQLLGMILPRESFPSSPS